MAEGDMPMLKTTAALLLGGIAALPCAARADDSTPVLTDDPTLTGGGLDLQRFGAGSCSPVDAHITTTFFLDGCASPTGLCTAGTIDIGPLAGTTSFVDLTVQPGAQPDSLAYTGLLTVTTAAGTVTISDFGFVDGTTGHFVEADRVLAGTGSFSGAVGMLTSRGVMTTTGFDGTISGIVCKATTTN